MNKPMSIVLKVTQILLYIEAAFFAIASLVATFALGAFGLLANADNGGQGLGKLGAVMGLWLLGCIVVVAAFVLIVAKLSRWRWAYWILIGCQLLLVVATLLAHPELTAYTVLQVIYPLVVVTGLVIPSSQHALGATWSSGGGKPKAK